MKLLRSLAGMAMVFALSFPVAAQQYPSPTFNVVSVTSNVGTSGNIPLSLKANGTEFLRGFDSGGGNMRVWMNQNSDTSIAPWFNLGGLVIAPPDGKNSIIGAVSNNLAPATTAFPTGVTGVGYNKSAGNSVFGMYGEAHTTTTGVAPAAEFAAFQDTAPAPTAFPFSNGIGTSQYLSKSIQATAGTATAVTLTGTISSGSTTVSSLSTTTGLYVGQFVNGTGIPANTSIQSINTVSSSMVISHAATTNGAVSITAKSPAAVGIEIGQEGSTAGYFQFGIGIGYNAVKQWSYFQEAQGDAGPNNGMYMGYNGSGIGIRVRALGTSSYNQNGNNAVFQVDSALFGDGVASIRQIGDIYGRAWVSNQKTGPTITTCSGVGTGGTCTLDSGSNDGTGTITITAGTGASSSGGSIGLTFSQSLGSNSSNCLLQTAGGSTTWAAGSVLNISSQSSSGVGFFWLNGVPGGTAITAGQTYKINYFCPGH